MLFNSFEFFVFLAVVYCLYLVLSHRWQNRMLLVASYVFYGWWDWRFVFLLATSTLITALGARGIHRQEDEARRKAAALSLEGVAGRIACPIYIMNGRQDRIVPATDAERLAREVNGEVTLHMIEDGNHIANNRAWRWRSHSADWMADRLRAA